MHCCSRRVSVEEDLLHRHVLVEAGLFGEFDTHHWDAELVWELLQLLNGQGHVDLGLLIVVKNSCDLASKGAAQWGALGDKEARETSLDKVSIHGLSLDVVHLSLILEVTWDIIKSVVGHHLTPRLSHLEGQRIDLSVEVCLPALADGAHGPWNLILVVWQAELGQVEIVISYKLIDLVNVDIMIKQVVQVAYPSAPIVV